MTDFMKLVEASVAADIAENARLSGQMTLGGLIDALKLAPPDAPCVFEDGTSPYNPDSYRGKYEQLAFGSSPPATVKEVLRQADKAVGETFSGYKGGDYRMTRGTLINRAEYGCAGEQIVGIETRNGSITILTKAEVW